MSEAGGASGGDAPARELAPGPAPDPAPELAQKSALVTERVAAWSTARYLLVVFVASAGALGALAWARPSIFTSVIVMAGHGHRFADPAPGSFYALRVAPVLEENCAGCHGPRLQRARLRLDTLGDVKLGGKSGPAVVAGDPRASALLARVLLPPGDKRAMPAGNKPPLSKDEIRVIELWIAAGASGETPVESIAGAPPPPTPPIEIEPLDPEAVAKARAPLDAQVRALNARYPDSIRYLSRDSAALGIDVQRMGADFGDADLAQFEPVATAVLRLDLSDTAITDAAAATLGAFERVEALRLNGTNIGDATLTAVSRIRALKTLTVIDTNASATRITELRERGVRVYDARE
jgi:mono/diheme cytochrome c family protein